MILYIQGGWLRGLLLDITPTNFPLFACTAQPLIELEIRVCPAVLLERTGREFSQRFADTTPTNHCLGASGVVSDLVPNRASQTALWAVGFGHFSDHQCHSLRFFVPYSVGHAVVNLLWDELVR